MSIDGKEFDKHLDPMKYILEFLRNNRERAFTAKFIADQVGLSEREVADALRWERFAFLLDSTAKTQTYSVTIGGVTYYRYRG